MAGGIDEPPLHTRLLQKLQGDVSTDSLSCSIFKVPNHLRQISEKAYEPQVISIGPYHHGKGQLMAMEVHKMFYLKMLLQRRKESSLEIYVSALKKTEKNARKFYSEPLDHIGEEKFVEMMLLDGCFIIELIRKSAMEELRSENDHLLTHFLLRRVMRDLLLVENQLPFSILSMLFRMTVMSNDQATDFMDMAINFFSRMMPGSQIGRSEYDQDIKHLLGLLHDSWHSSEVVRRSPPQERPIPWPPAPSFPSERFSPPNERPTRQKPAPPVISVRFERPPPPKFYPSGASLRFLPPKERSPPEQPAPSVPSVSFPPPKERHPPEKPASEPSIRFPSPNESPRDPPDEHFWEPCSLPSIRFPPPNESPRDPPDEHFLEPCSLPSISFPPPNESPRDPPDEHFWEPCSLPSISFPPPNERPPPPKTAPSVRAARFPPPKKRAVEKWRFISSAIELSEAGINFKKIEGRLFDIKFENGIMSIPTLSINDDTESILRNLVAYEQCFEGASSKCFTDYLTFMDCLINTGKDVELLCRRGVIDNWLGDHEVVATLFNKLRDSVSISEQDFFYAETFNKVNKHCDKKWNQWKANLWHNYFNTPWAGISFFAAVFLLLLTVLQSVYSVLSYLFK